MSRVHVKSNINSANEYKLIFLVSGGIIAFLCVNLFAIISKRLTDHIDPASRVMDTTSQSSCTQHNNRQRGRVNKHDRINQLIQKHGGKDISRAIKFLTSEMQNQKYSIFENLLDYQRYDCTCSCHEPQD